MSVTYGLYFWFSLIYLIIRTLAVSLYSAQINDEATRPNDVIRSVPRDSWCLEVRKDKIQLLQKDKILINLLSSLI
jgi:gustatory receptor